MNSDKLWQIMPNSDEFWQTMTNYARFWWTLTNYANVDIKLPGGKIQVFVDIKIAIRSQTIPLSFFIFLQFHIYITENNSQAHFDSKMLILWPVWLEFQTSKFALLDRARQSMIRLTRDSKIFRLDPSLLLSLPTIEEVNQKDFYSKMSFFKTWSSKCQDTTTQPVTSISVRDVPLSKLKLFLQL